MTIASFTELTVGQEVGLDTSFSHAHGKRIEKVTRVTKTQITLECGYKFNRASGREIKSAKSSYPTSRLCTVEYVQRVQAESELRRKITNEVSAIKKILDSHRNGYGQHSISQATKDQLLELVSSMTVNAS